MQILILNKDCNYSNNNSSNQTFKNYAYSIVLSVLTSSDTFSSYPVGTLFHTIAAIVRISLEETYFTNYYISIHTAILEIMFIIRNSNDNGDSERYQQLFDGTTVGK